MIRIISSGEFRCDNEESAVHTLVWIFQIQLIYLPLLNLLFNFYFVIFRWHILIVTSETIDTGQFYADDNPLVMALIRKNLKNGTYKDTCVFNEEFAKYKIFVNMSDLSKSQETNISKVTN